MDEDQSQLLRSWLTKAANDLAETYPTREEFDEAIAHAQTIYDFVLSLLPPTAHPT